MRYRWPLMLWIAFFSVGYGMSFLHGFPVVKYYPAAHAWGFEGAFPDPAMAWFGKTAAGMLAGMIGVGIGAIIVRVKGAEARPPLPFEIAALILACVSATYAAHFEWVKWMQIGRAHV